jgi:hypothetical protein
MGVIANEKVVVMEVEVKMRENEMVCEVMGVDSV